MKPNKENLRTLAYYLMDGLRAKFDMKHYEDEEYDHKEGTCGSTGCAVGHGPYATGILKKSNEGWNDYCERVFGIPVYFAPGLKLQSYIYMFEGEWFGYDNTPVGAARRIIRFLSHDCQVPEGFEYPCEEFVI